MTQTNDNTQDVFTKGCLVILNISQYSGRMTIPKVLMKEKMNTDKVGGHKKVLPKKALKDIQSFSSSTRTWLKDVSLPFPVNAAVFVPFEMVEYIDNVLKRNQIEFDRMVDVLSENYQDYIEQVRPELEQADLFNGNDYPTNIKSKFSFSWRFVTLNTPGESSVLSPEFIKKEQAKFQDTLNDAKDTALQAIRQQFYDIVTHAVEKLTVKDGEKKKVFKSSTIDKFSEFFKTFSKRNCFGDDELKSVVDNAREIMDGVSAKDLRNDDEYREAIADCLTEVKDEMNDGIINAGRKLNLTD